MERFLEIRNKKQAECRGSQAECRLSQAECRLSMAEVQGTSDRGRRSAGCRRRSAGCRWRRYKVQVTGASGVHGVAGELQAVDGGMQGVGDTYVYSLGERSDATQSEDLLTSSLTHLLNFLLG